MAKFILELRFQIVVRDTIKGPELGRKKKGVAAGWEETVARGKLP